jgi:uncharacterized protein (UPF0335 family)
MADFGKDAMAAGFAAAVASRTEAKPASGAADASGIRKTRLRGGRKTEARDPGSAKVIESNALRIIVDRIVRLENEKGEVSDSIKAEYASAKEDGYEVKALRLVVKRALEDEDKRVAREAVELTTEQMMAALGMLRDTPLGKAAMEAVERAD